MVEQTQHKLKLASMDRFERWSLFSSILIWTGVLAFGIGLFVTLRNQRIERQAYASLGTETPTPVATATVTPLPTQTPQRYPAGWSTATPTPATKSSTRQSQEDRSIDTTENPTRRPDDRVDGTVERTAPRLALTPKSPPPPSKPPDRLAIPKIKLDSPIVPIGWVAVEQEGTQARVWQVADEVVGWHQTSSHPGQGGNIVLNGHHNIKGEVFRYLVDLEVGDQIYLYAQDEPYTFSVTEKHILKEKGEPLAVRRENATWIEPTDDERLTMITCWPYTNNTHRLVVVAKPAPTRSIEGLHE